MGWGWVMRDGWNMDALAEQRTSGCNHPCLYAAGVLCTVPQGPGVPFSAESFVFRGCAKSELCAHTRLSQRHGLRLGRSGKTSTALSFTYPY